MQERRKRRAIPRQTPPARARELCRGTRLPHAPAEHSPSGSRGVAEGGDSICAVTAGSSCSSRGWTGPANARTTTSERGAHKQTPLLPPQPRGWSAGGCPDPAPPSSRDFSGDVPGQRDPPGRPRVPGAAGPAWPPSGRCCGADPGSPLSQPHWALPQRRRGGASPGPPARRRGGAEAAALPRRRSALAATPPLLPVPGSGTKCPGQGHKRRQPPASPPRPGRSAPGPSSPGPLGSVPLSSPAQRRSSDDAFRPPLLFLMQEFLPLRNKIITGFKPRNRRRFTFCRYLCD